MSKTLCSFVIMLACIASACISDEDPKGPSLSVGDPLPSFSVSLNNGETVSTTSLKGKVAVIVFFNTKCGDCRQELSVIQNLWEFYKEDTGVEIVPIARDENEEDIMLFWKEKGLSMPFSPQNDSDIYLLFAPSVIPRIYIANPQGIIIMQYDDSNMPSLETLVSDIQRVISNKEV